MGKSAIYKGKMTMSYLLMSMDIYIYIGLPERKYITNLHTYYNQ